MYKKIMIFIVIVCPILFCLAVGYPVDTGKKHSSIFDESTIHYSERCYKVGEFHQFVGCLFNHPKLNGIKMVTSIKDRINDLYPQFGYIFIILIALHLVMTGRYVVDSGKNHNKITEEQSSEK
jgi:hypothetical protein